METIQTKDVEAMMNEVRESLSSPIEFDTIGEIQILMASIRQNYEIREITMQRGVREQANALEELKDQWKEAEAYSNSGRFENAKDELLRQRELYQREIAQLEREEMLETATEEDTTTIKSQVELHWILKQSKMEKILKEMAKQFSLYLQVSSLKWDYDALPEVVKGVIYMPDDMRPFDFSTEEMEQFEITNRLWELIE